MVKFRRVRAFDTENLAKDMTIVKKIFKSLVIRSKMCQFSLKIRSLKILVTLFQTLSLNVYIRLSEETLKVLNSTLTRSKVGQVY